MPTNPSPSSYCPVGVGHDEFKQKCQFPSGDLECLSERRLFLRPWRWCPPQQKPAPTLLGSGQFPGAPGSQVLTGVGSQGGSAPHLAPGSADLCSEEVGAGPCGCRVPTLVDPGKLTLPPQTSCHRPFHGVTELRSRRFFMSRRIWPAWLGAQTPVLTLHVDEGRQVASVPRPDPLLPNRPGLQRSRPGGTRKPLPGHTGSESLRNDQQRHRGSVCVCVSGFGGPRPHHAHGDTDLRGCMVRPGAHLGTPIPTHTWRSSVSSWGRVQLPWEA